MADTGHQSPLGTNDLSSLLQNYGLQINSGVTQLAGASTAYENYTFGQICEDTCLRLQTHGVHEAWLGNPDGKPNPAVYNNLIYIGAQSSSIAPTAITSERGIFKVTFPLNRTFPIGTILRFENVTPPAYNGSFAVTQSAPGVVWFNSPIDPGDATATGLMYYNISVPALGNSIPLPYVWEGAPYWGGSLYKHPNPVTQWAFCRLWALQAYNDFNFNQGLPEYKDFLGSFNEAFGFIQQSNEVILSFSNARYFLKGTYSNQDDLTSADIAGVNLATQTFGQDIVNLGNAIDFSYMDSFGLPSNLLFTLEKNNAINKSITLALIGSGMETTELSDLLSRVVTPTKAQEVKIYNAFQIIVGPALRETLISLGCVTRNLESLADLLNIEKIFPDSYQSMTVPIYNSVGLTPPRFTPTPEGGQTDPVAPSILPSFQTQNAALSIQTPTEGNGFQSVRDPYGNTAWKLSFNASPYLNYRGMYYQRESSAINTAETWSILAKAGSVSRVIIGFSNSPNNIFPGQTVTATVDLTSGTVLQRGASTDVYGNAIYYDVNPTVTVESKGDGWYLLTLTAVKKSTSPANYPFISSQYTLGGGEIFVSTATVPGPTTTSSYTPATNTTPVIVADWTLYANLNLGIPPQSQTFTFTRNAFVIPKNTTTFSLNSSITPWSRFACVVKLDSPPSRSTPLTPAEYQTFVNNTTGLTGAGVSWTNSTIWTRLNQGEEVVIVADGSSEFKIRYNDQVSGPVFNQASRALYIRALGSTSDFVSPPNSPPYTSTQFSTPTLIPFNNIALTNVGIDLVPVTPNSNSVPTTLVSLSGGYAPIEPAPPSKIYYPLYGTGSVPATPPAQGGYGGFVPNAPAYKPYVQTFNPYTASTTSAATTYPTTSVTSNSLNQSVTTNNLSPTTTAKFVTGPGDGTQTPTYKDPNWDYNANNQFGNFKNYLHDREYFALEFFKNNSNLFGASNPDATGFSTLPRDAQRELLQEYARTYNISADAIPTSVDSNGKIRIDLAPGSVQPPLSVDEWGNQKAREKGWLDAQGKSTLPLDNYQLQDKADFERTLPFIQAEIGRKLSGQQEWMPGDTRESLLAAAVKFGVDFEQAKTGVTTNPTTQNNTGVETTTQIPPVTIPATTTPATTPGTNPVPTYDGSGSSEIEGKPDPTIFDSKGYQGY